MSFNRINSLGAGALNDTWIADLESLSYLEGGVPMSAAFAAQARPSGTVVSIDASGELSLNTEGGEEETPRLYVTRFAHTPGARVGAGNGMSVVAGGVLHVDRLPGELTVGEVAALGQHYTLQNDSQKTFDPGI